MLLNTLDTTVTIQRGKKLGYSLPMKTDYEETQNLRRYNVQDVPNHTDKDQIFQRIDKYKSINELFSMKSDFSGTPLVIPTRIRQTGFAGDRTIEREKRCGRFSTIRGGLKSECGRIFKT